MATAAATATTAATSTKAVLLYDGNCPLCKRSVRILKKLDWFGAADYRDCRDVGNWPPGVPLEMAALLDQMHLVTPGGAVYAGFRAFRWLSWRLPLTLPFAPALYLPGVPWLGNKVYLWIARNRYKLVPCQDGVCTLPRPPARH